MTSPAPPGDSVERRRRAPSRPGGGCARRRDHGHGPHERAPALGRRPTPRPGPLAGSALAVFTEPSRPTLSQERRRRHRGVAGSQRRNASNASPAPSATGASISPVTSNAEVARKTGSREGSSPRTVRIVTATVSPTGSIHPVGYRPALVPVASAGRAISTAEPTGAAGVAGGGCSASSWARLATAAGSSSLSFLAIYSTLQRREAFTEGRDGPRGSPMTTNRACRTADGSWTGLRTRCDERRPARSSWRPSRDPDSSAAPARPSRWRSTLWTARSRRRRRGQQGPAIESPRGGLAVPYQSLT